MDVTQTTTLPDKHLRTTGFLMPCHQTVYSIGQSCWTMDKVSRVCLISLSAIPLRCQETPWQQAVLRLSNITTWVNHVNATATTATTPESSTNLSLAMMGTLMTVTRGKH